MGEVAGGTRHAEGATVGGKFAADAFFAGECTTILLVVAARAAATSDQISNIWCLAGVLFGRCTIHVLMRAGAVPRVVAEKLILFFQSDAVVAWTASSLALRIVLDLPLLATAVREFAGGTVLAPEVLYEHPGGAKHTISLPNLFLGLACWACFA